MLRKTGIVVSALVIVGLIGAAAAGPNRASGVVRGSVVSGPTCPGPARLDRKNCAPRPLQTKVTVFATTAQDRGAGAKPVRTVVTDRVGRFAVTLAPGRYRLVPASPGGVSIGKPRDVTVTAGSTTDVRLFADTGMR